MKWFIVVAFAIASICSPSEAKPRTTTSVKRAKAVPKGGAKRKVKRSRDWHQTKNDIDSVVDEMRAGSGTESSEPTIDVSELELSN